MFHPLFIKRNMEDIRKYMLRRAYDDINQGICSLSEDCKFDTFPVIEVEADDEYFNFKVEVFWEIANYHEYNDECDYDYTGDWHGFELLSAVIIDDDGNEKRISKEIINEFNNKYGQRKD